MLDKRNFIHTHHGFVLFFDFVTKKIVWRRNVEPYKNIYLLVREKA